MSYYAETEEVTGTGGILVNVGTDAIGTTAINRHISRADNIINTRLSKRYTVPFSTGTATPPVIKTISTDLAAYFIMRSLFTKDAQNKNDWVDDLKFMALDTLKRIEKGETKLLDIADNEIAQLEVDDLSSNTQDYAPIFNVDSDLNQEVDSDRLDGISDERE